MAVDLGRLDWLARTREDPVDATQPIVDPHFHLWTDADVGAGDYLVDDYTRDSRSGHNITHSVFVEPGGGARQSGPVHLRPVGVTEFVATQAQLSTGDTRISGIVGHVDLTSDPSLVEEALSAHETAGRGLFRGVRHGLAHDSDPALLGFARADLISDPSISRSVSMLGDAGYTFDAWIYHPQLPQLATLARHAPHTNIVVDHLGVPLYARKGSSRGEVRAQWRRHMRELAALDNVTVKLSGLGMEFVFGQDWSMRATPPSSDELLARWGDDIRWVIDTFGPARCMFASNYPVDRQAVGYTVLWNTFQKAAGEYSPSERNALLRDTAARIYRIDMNREEKGSRG